MGLNVPDGHQKLKQVTVEYGKAISMLCMAASRAFHSYTARDIRAGFADRCARATGSTNRRQSFVLEALAGGAGIDPCTTASARRLLLSGAIAGLCGEARWADAVTRHPPRSAWPAAGWSCPTHGNAA